MPLGRTMTLNGPPWIRQRRSAPPSGVSAQRSTPSPNQRLSTSPQDSPPRRLTAELRLVAAVAAVVPGVTDSRLVDVDAAVAAEQVLSAAVLGVSGTDAVRSPGVYALCVIETWEWK